ncbi:rhomboid family intramembrane serine protease [Sphingobacterium spiritivorum]|uniref:rhomboid family intramembrane serine protease n=1 Tax=Sphingobacterium spiritivorum TaxID=258 RepID=UPI003DA4944E
MPAIFDILPTPAESPWSYTLVPVIIICSIIGFYYKPFFYKLLLHPYEICRGKRWHTLFTSALVHRSCIHLLVNVVLIYALLYDLFGLIKQEYGTNAAYLLSILIILCLVVIPNLFQTYIKKDDFTYTAVGASGLTFGLYGFSFLYFPLQKMSSFWIEAIKVSAQFWLAVLIVILLLSFVPKSKVNKGLHIFAFLLGSVLAFCVRPPAFLEFVNSFKSIFQ